MERKKIFLRVDFNVPLTDEGRIADDTRIKAALPTITYLLERKSALIIASHLGRPKGKIVDKLRLDPVARRLEELLRKKVMKLNEVAGETVRKRAHFLQPGEIMLLENVRFHPGEEKNDPDLSRFFASLAELFVNDAFGTAHRAHASTAGVGEHLPAVAGLLMEKELKYLEQALTNPPRPLVLLLGGKKVSDKIGVLRTFIKKADYILIGGAMANTFLAAKGKQMGKSFLEKEKIEEAKAILSEAENNKVQFYLPLDFVAAAEMAPGVNSKVVAAGEMPPEMMALDIGPKTGKLFSDIIAAAGMVIWNGPLGVFELEPFYRGTAQVAEALASSSALSLVGGGDILAALQKLGLAAKMTHLSTGGGATLEFLEGKELPGVAVLQESESAPASTNA